jgi:hypothetical protein
MTRSVCTNRRSANTDDKRSFRAHLTNDSDIVSRGLELPEGDIDGDTTLTLGLELVQNPGILEGALAQLSGFLLFVSTALVLSAGPGLGVGQ